MANSPSASVISVSFLALVACSSTSTVKIEPCTAGEKVSCELGSCTGSKTCNPDGKGYGACVCGSGGAAGTGGASGGSGGAPSGGTSGAGGVGGSPGTVVTTLDQTGVPKAAVTVVVHDADGHVVTTTQTGADGTVDVQVPDGGAVTIADDALMTYLDLSGADSIVATVGGDPLYDLPTLGAGTALTLNVSSPLNLAYYDVVASPCLDLLQRQDTASATYDLSACPTSPLDVWVIGYSSTGFPMAFGTLFNVSPIPGATRTESITVATSTFSDVTGSIGPLPNGATAVSELAKLRRADRMVGSFTDYQTPTGTAPVDYSIRMPSLAVDGFRLQQEVDWPGHSASHDLRSQSLSAAQGTWSPLALAPVDVTTGVTFPQTGRPHATWSLGTGQSGDAIAIYMMWSPSSGDSNQWMFVVPASATEMQAPELPASLSGYGIGAGASVNYYQVIHLDMPSTTGYLPFLRASTKPGFFGYFPSRTTQNCEVVRSSGSLP